MIHLIFLSFSLFPLCCLPYFSYLISSYSHPGLLGGPARVFVCCYFLLPVHFYSFHLCKVSDSIVCLHECIFGDSRSVSVFPLFFYSFPLYFLHPYCCVSDFVVLLSVGVLLWIFLEVCFLSSFASGYLSFHLALLLRKLCILDNFAFCFFH